jgi:hypothetical protein
MDGDSARLALDRFPASRQLVEALAFELQRRVHRRDLVLLADERRQHRIDGAIVERRHGSALDDLGLTIARLGARAELHQHPVRLPGIQQPAANLGGLPEADRQQAGRKGIETAGMPRLGGIEQRADLLKRRVRRNAECFVEQQDAVDGAIEPTRHIFQMWDTVLLGFVFVVDVTLGVVLDGFRDERRQTRAALD